MKIRVLGASGGEGLSQRPSCFLVDGHTLVDAGSVTGTLDVGEQGEIENVLVSHSHLDHVGGLAFLTETLALTGRPRPLTVIGIEAVIEALRASFFNDVVWTDFARIPSAEKPVVRYRTLAERAEQEVGSLRVTPVAVHHSVPASGFVVHDGSSGFVYSGDTGPTEALWEAARAVPQVRAVILECSFPDRLGDLARCSGHLTPALVARELPKLPPDVPVWIFHLKPQLRDETAAELDRLGESRILLLEDGGSYDLDAAPGRRRASVRAPQRVSRARGSAAAPARTRGSSARSR